MILTEKTQKVIKWISYSIQVLLIVLVITFGCLTSNRGKIIKTQKLQVKALTEQVDSLKRVNSALGAEEVFTVNVTFNLNQKNVLSQTNTNAQNIAKDIAKMTRQELYDSLYSKKFNDNGTVLKR